MGPTKSVFLLFFVFIIGSSCQKKDPYDDMARAMCDCMKPMAEMYRKMQDLSAAGNTPELAGMMDELEDVAEEAEVCTDKMREKYGEPEDEEKANAALKRICPEVSSVLEEMDEGLQ